MPDRRTTRWMHLRLYTVAGILVLLALVLVWRMWSLQVKQGQWLGELSRQQVLKAITLEPIRGAILDRNGMPLAISVPADSVYAMPTELGDPAADGRKLARALSLSPDESAKLLRRLSRRKHFTWVGRRLSPRQAEAVRQLGLPGVYFTKESRRFYPGRELAAKVLGFTVDGRGLEGMELQFDDLLRGSTVLVQGLRDAYGRLLMQDSARQPEGGGTLVLTIDAALQDIVERELARGLQEAGGRAAIAMVIVPQSGEILAMAGLPSYNPNVFSRSTAEQRRNLAVTDCFEPGSTMKVFTMAAALERGKVKAEDIIDCEGGSLKIGSHTIRDAHQGLTKITVSEALSKSSNVAMAKIGQMLGSERLYNVLSAFGFGRRTGLELPGEAACTLRPPASWPEVMLATVSFGQGLSATALQLTSAMAAVANGGMAMRPQLVREVRAPDGRLLGQFQPEPMGRVISSRTAATLTEMLIKACLPGGTGTAAAVPGFSVAGKTGTAQKADLVAGGYSPDKRVASFLGFAPAEAPRLTVLVLIDEPTINVYGGVVAAPIFSRIMEASLRHLGVFPTPAVASPAPTAEAVLPEESALAVVDNDPPILAAPAPGAVPNVLGLSLRQAARKLWQGRWQVEVSGWGWVDKQHPAPGSPLAAGEVVRLQLSRRRSSLRPLTEEPLAAVQDHARPRATPNVSAEAQGGSGR